jgi:hypothetical protein
MKSLSQNPEAKKIVIFLQLALWVISVASIAWLWDRWMLDGPHGPYRWVGMDFAPFWVGVRDMLHGINPYSQETNLKTQIIVYGGPAAGQDPMMFVYPAWMFILIAPFSLMPYKWAVILYSGTMLWAILNLLYQLASRLGQQNYLARSLWLAWLVFGNLPFMVISITKGQLGYLCILALFTAYTIWKQKPMLGGIVLGLALIKPTVTVIPVMGFLFWAIYQRNWKFFYGFVFCITTLLATSLLTAGNWLPGYFKMLSIKGGMPVLWSMDVLSMPWNILFIATFISILFFAVYLSLKKNRDYWFPALILLGVAITPMRWIYDLFLCILVLTSTKKLSRFELPAVGLAIFSPWLLAVIPEETRWIAAIIGLPLIWASTLLIRILVGDILYKKLQ